MNSERHPNDQDASTLALSPQQSAIYNRRRESRNTQLPSLPSPKRRKVETVADSIALQPDPPSPVAQPFNIFQALLQNPELTFEFSKQLPVNDLVSLYAISKDFHYLANRRFTALILGQSVFKAPESSRVFTFTCYRSLCLSDPNRTQLRGMNGMIRTIPSFRWLRMVLFREQVVDDIMGHLYEHGHRLPLRASLVVKKLWLTLDFSDNVRRVGLMHNEDFWSSKDLFLATMFFVKLDMRLNDPLTGSGHMGLRRMLLNQRSLSTLARVLQRKEMKRDLDMLRMTVLYNYAPRTGSRESILGIEPKHVGKLQFEGWGARPTKFIPIDELIGREGLKRGLQLHHYYIDMMIFGYIDKRTFQDVHDAPPGTFAGQGYSIQSTSKARAMAMQGDQAIDMTLTIGGGGDGSDHEEMYGDNSSEEETGSGTTHSNDDSDLSPGLHENTKQ